MKPITNILFGLAVLALALPAYAQDITVITEFNPPFNFGSQEHPTGIATEIFVRMARRAGLNLKRQDIRIWPWARGYEEIQKRPNVILFAMARTKSREDLFQWIGPIMPLKSTIIARADSDISITDLRTDARRYRIGTIRDSASEQYLIKNGANPDDLQRVHDIRLNIKKLMEGRIDLMLVMEATLLHTIQSMGLTSDEFEVVHTLFSADLYYATSKDMHPDTVQRLQQALDDLRTEVFVDSIIEDFLH